MVLCICWYKCRLKPCISNMYCRMELNRQMFSRCAEAIWSSCAFNFHFMFKSVSVFCCVLFFASRWYIFFIFFFALVAVVCSFALLLFVLIDTLSRTQIRNCIEYLISSHETPKYLRRKEIEIHTSKALVKALSFRIDIDLELFTFRSET